MRTRVAFVTILLCVGAAVVAACQADGGSLPGAAVDVPGTPAAPEAAAPDAAEGVAEADAAAAAEGATGRPRGLAGGTASLQVYNALPDRTTIVDATLRLTAPARGQASVIALGSGLKSGADGAFVEVPAGAGRIELRLPGAGASLRQAVRLDADRVYCAVVDAPGGSNRLQLTDVTRQVGADAQSRRRVCADLVSAPAADVPAPIAAAREDLADVLRLEPGQIAIASQERVDWSSSAMGCPEKGQAYLTVIVPGWRVIFEAASRRYEYHTNDAEPPAFVRCETPAD